MESMILDRQNNNDQADQLKKSMALMGDFVISDEEMKHAQE